MTQDIPVIDCDVEGALARLAVKCIVKSELAKTLKEPPGQYDLDTEKGLYHHLVAIAGEYWKPDFDSRTINLEIFPYWLDRQKFMDGLDEFWTWADEQQKQIAMAIHLACNELEAMEVPSHRIEAPLAWRDFVLNHTIFGLPVTCGDWQRDLKARVYSEDKFGRFVPIRWTKKEKAA